MKVGVEAAPAAATAAGAMPSMTINVYPSLLYIFEFRYFFRILTNSVGRAFTNVYEIRIEWVRANESNEWKITANDVGYILVPL